MTFKGLYQVNPLRFIFAAINYVLVALTAILQSYLIMYEITALSNRRFNIWLWFILAEFLILLVTGISYSLGDYLARKQVQEYNHVVRAKTISHYYFDNQDHSVSSMQNRLTTDLKNVNASYLLSGFNCIKMACYVLFVMIALISIHWSLLLITFLSVILSIYLPKILEKPLQKAFSNISDTNKKYLDVAGKWLAGLNVLQRYMAGAKLFHVMDDAAKELQDSNVKKTKVDQELNVLDSAISSLIMLMLFVFTAVLIVNKLVVFGVISTIGSFQFYLSFGLRNFTNYRGQMKSTKPLNAKIAADSAEIQNKQQADNAIATAFAGKNLSIAFPNSEKLTFPDFTVKTGEKVLLSGDSGVGKSTLFKLILGELKPTSGEIIYFDQENHQIKPDLSKIGYIAQTPRLFPDTIENNITMFNGKLNSKVDKVIHEVDFKNDLAKFKDGKKEEINLDKLNISGGQRQKIVLARAMIHDRDLILIDEGTSAIDQKATMDILKNLVKSKATIVFIAHSFNEEMRKLFDREICLKKI